MVTARVATESSSTISSCPYVASSVARVSDLCGSAEGHLVAVEAEHEVEGAGALHVVARHEQRPPLGAQLVEDAVDQRRAGGVDARERLVEQKHARVLDQRAGEERALALAARQLAEANARGVGEAHALERGCGSVSFCAARRQPPAAGRERAHQRHVERGHREVEARALGLGHVRGAAAELDAAGRGLQLAKEHAKQRRLAAAVRAQHADRLAGARLERDVLEHRHAAVARGKLLDGHGGLAHAVRLRVAAAITMHTSAPSTATGGPAGTSSQ